MSLLTPQELAQYRERGYVIPNYRLPQPLLARL